MKLTENTKVRIRVPKHLYEAIQAELDKKHGIEEEMDQTHDVNEADGEQASVEEIAAAMDKAVAFAKKLAQQIADKKGGSLTQKDFFRLIDNFRSKVKDFGPFKSVDRSEYMEEDQMNEWVGVNPDHDTLTLMLGLAVPVLTAIIAAGPKAIGQAAWSAAKSALSKKKKGEEPVAEMEETLDLESLMEAVKDASKKKVEDKKKKELEAKKKKAEDEKKKKEAEAKKKVAAAKKK